MNVKKEQLFIQSENIEWQSIGNGIRRRIMAYGANLMAVSVEFKKGAVGSLHKHPHIQISYVHSGVFEIEINNEKKKLKSGDFFYIPENIEHGVVALEDGVLLDFFTPMREDFILKNI